MLKDLVSDFVKQAPPYNFGLGAGQKPIRPGIDYLYEMNKNENPYGISPKAAAAMKEYVDSSNRYPDIKAESLCRRLAAFHQIPADHIMVTQGATSALGFIGEVFIGKGTEVIVAAPTYPNYYNIIKKNGGTIVEVKMPETMEPDFDALYAAITEKTRLIFLCNPNNPTGTICDDDALIAFMNRLPDHVVLVVDEAYFDFIDKPGYKSMIPQIAEDKNLIVVKTFAKTYGMAGARIGYVLSNPEIIGYLQITATGFCCNRAGLQGAEAALDDQEFIAMSIRENKKCRDYMTQELKKLGFTVWPSHSNFIFFDAKMPPAYLAEELYTYGIKIRGDFPQARLSLGTMQQCEAAVEAIRKIKEEYEKQAEK